MSAACIDPAYLGFEKSCGPPFQDFEAVYISRRCSMDDVINSVFLIARYCLRHVHSQYHVRIAHELYQYLQTCDRFACSCQKIN